MSKKRRGLPSSLIDALLLRSKRRCALCYRSGNTHPQPGSVAHIRAESAGESDSLDNLVYLCAMHHATLDRQGSGNWSPAEVAAARDELYRDMDREAADLTSHRPRVFIVHGHDEEARHQLVRFLERVGIDAVSLVDRPNFGLTILEKFERNTDVSYAIALLPTDDQGGQARQNVIFELGYLMGLLGRHNVCALAKPGVEVPSDFHGMQFLQLDARGEWREVLRRELIAAGLPVATGEDSKGLEA